MTEVGIFQELSEQKLEPISDNGKILTIRTIPEDLNHAIRKLVAGVKFYISRHQYIDEIEQLAIKYNLSFYAVGLLIKQACRLAQIPDRTVYSMLPDKYKDPALQDAGKKGAEASNIEESTSQSLQVAENADKKDIEDLAKNIPTEYTIQEAEITTSGSTQNENTVSTTFLEDHATYGSIEEHKGNLRLIEELQAEVLQLKAEIQRLSAPITTKTKQDIITLDPLAFGSQYMEILRTKKVHKLHINEKYEVDKILE